MSGAPHRAGDDGARTAVVVVALAFAFNFVGRGVADVFAAFVLPLEAEFGWSRQATTGVFATYQLTTGLAAPAVGWVLDRLGPRVVYTGGLLLLAAGTGLAARVDAAWQLYPTAGVLVGLGSASLGMVGATALIGRWYRRHLSTAIAIAYAGFGSGILVLMPLVQALIEAQGWRAAWAWLGTGAAVLALPCAVLPWRRLAGDAPRGTPGAGADAPPRGPTLRDAVRSRPYRQLVQSFFFTAFASFLITPQTVAFLVEAGYAPLTAATAYGAAGLLSTAGIIAAGWLAGRIGFGPTALISYASTTIGLLALVAASFAPWTALLVAYVVCFGLVQGARGPLISTMTQRIFAGSSAGTIFGTVFLSMALGAASGTFAGGVLHDLSGGYRPVLVLSLVSIAIAAAPFRAGSAMLGALARAR